MIVDFFIFLLKFLYWFFAVVLTLKILSNLAFPYRLIKKTIAYHGTDKPARVSIIPLDIILFPFFFAITYIIQNIVRLGNPYTIKYVTFVFGGGICISYAVAFLFTLVAGFILSKKGYVKSDD